MLWSKTPIHVIDFEGARSYGVVEFGVVSIFEGKIVNTATSLCQACRPMDSREERFHGITNYKTRKQAPFSEYFSNFSELRNTGCLAAHHAVVENGLIKSVWPYPPFSPDFLNNGKKIADWGPWIDTRILYASLFQQLESHKLGDLLQTFSLEDHLQDLAHQHCSPDRKRYHCALYDALGAALLLLYLGQLSEFKPITLEWLMANSLPKKDRRDPLSQGEFFDL